MSLSLFVPEVDAAGLGCGPDWLATDELLVTATEVARATLPVRSDRDRLLDATSTLITAIEAVRPMREMQRLRGELNVLQHDVEHMRRAVGLQSAVGCPVELTF